jgi:uncharacterized caspase-like protein
VDIHRAIVNFFKNAKPGQTLLFYFSGHGIPREEEIYLAMPEVNTKDPMVEGFSLTRLSQLMRSSKSMQIVSIVDACYSGAAKLPESKGFIDKDAAESDAIAANDTYHNILNIPKAEGKCLLLSSQAYERSKASENDNSIYTKYIIEGLRGAKESIDDSGRLIPASYDNNGNVTPETLHEYVYQKVANEVKQTPKMKSDKSSKIILAKYPELAVLDVSEMSHTEWEDENEASHMIKENEAMSFVAQYEKAVFSYTPSDTILREAIWEELLEFIKKNKCTPFIGERVYFGVLPSGKEIAKAWAKEYEYPFHDSFTILFLLKHSDIDIFR